MHGGGWQVVVAVIVVVIVVVVAVEVGGQHTGYRTG